MLVLLPPPWLTKFNPNEPRDANGRWTTGGGSGKKPPKKPVGGEGPVRVGPNGLIIDPAGKPIIVYTVDEALKRLKHGQGIMFERPDQVVSLLDKISAMVAEAKAKGKDAPVIDLCKVHVANTNLFCSQSMQIPRSQMPQLSGKPRPGSPADKLPRNEWGEVSIEEQFHAHLRAKGVTIEEISIDASRMRATQNQLDGRKVAGIIASGKVKTPDRLYISKENYIIDGHHRWAANVGESYKEGKTVYVPVHRVNMPILDLLKESITFAQKQGVMSQSIGEGSRGKGFDPNEPRDEDGRWTSGGGSASGGPKPSAVDGHSTGSAVLDKVSNSVGVNDLSGGFFYYALQAEYMKERGFTAEENEKFKAIMDGHTRDHTQAASDKLMQEAIDAKQGRLYEFMQARAHAEEAIVDRLDKVLPVKFAEARAARFEEFKRDVASKFEDYDPEYHGTLHEAFESRYGDQFKFTPFNQTKVFRRGGADKDILSTSTSEIGANTQYLNGEEGARIAPNHSWTVGELRGMGYRPTAGLTALYGYVGESEVLFLKMPRTTVKGFNPSEPRDEDGRWTTGGSAFDMDRSKPYKEQAKKVPAEQETVAKKWESTLTPKEKAALVEYYTPLGWAINEHLRAGTDFQFSTVVSDMKSAGQKMPAVGKDTFVYRGIGADVVEAMKKQPVFEDKGFISTTLSPLVAASFADQDAVILRIRLPKEAKAVNISALKPERSPYRVNEVLLINGSRFRLLNRTPREEVIGRDVTERGGKVVDIKARVYDVEVVL